MIPQNMDTGTLHRAEGVGDVPGSRAVRVLIEVVDPIAQLHDEIRPNRVDPIDEGLQERQGRGAQFRPLVDFMVNIRNEGNPQYVSHPYFFPE